MKFNKRFLSVCMVIAGINIFMGCSIGNNDYPSYVKNVEVNEEFLNSMSDKELIVYKMINSIDFYENAFGTFSKFNKEDESNETIEYWADIKNKKSHYIDSDGTELLVKDNKRYFIDNNKKTYLEDDIKDEKDDNIPKLKLKDRLANSEKYAYRRDGAFLDILEESLFNQNEAFSEIKGLDNWEINKEVDYLGRKAVEITGKIIGERDFGGKSFYVLIDKETGIVLVFRYLDVNNNVLYSLETKNIQIDKGISDKNFEKDLSGYKKK